MKLVCLILRIVWYWTARFKGCEGGAAWNNFASSPGYVNSRLVVPGNLFTPRYISKGSSLIWARMDCSRSCATNDTCLAFNFYENEQYICELLSVNLCRNQNATMLTNQSRGSVWDKLTTGMNSSCYEILPNATLDCEVVRRGCLGIVPNCFNCTKTCIEWSDRLDDGYTLWPDGDAPNSIPITGQCCVNDITVLISRKINLTTGQDLMNYTMSFQDMHRIFKLKAYLYLQFAFVGKFSGLPRSNRSIYTNAFIEENGTLTNMTYHVSDSSAMDIFNLKGLAMKATPFVKVTDDRYSCGSFWLLNVTNQTYCPGGSLSIFGTVKFNATQVINTGIHLPGDKPTDVITEVKVTLSNG